MKVLGITGKIGSGKTTVIDIIKNKYNVHILNLDEIAKKIIIEKNIKFDIFNNDFLSNEQLEFVKKNIHPKVWEYVKHNIKKLYENKNIDFLVIETALPNDIFFDICDETICINSKNSIHFLKKYRKYDDKKIEKILAEQKKYEVFYKKCNKFINNDFDKNILNGLIIDTINDLFNCANKSIKIISIRSSSDGNCTLVSYGKKNFLIDCGISFKILNECLYNHNLTLDDINAVFITHKHSDHIKSIETILSKHKIKIFGLKETLIEIFNLLSNKKIEVDPKLFYPLHIQNNFHNYNKSIRFDDNVIIKYCEAYHDVPCIFYKFYIGNLVFANLTDCGMYDTNIINFLSDVNYLMLECNYDIEMLTKNPTYPDYLKKRISGNMGHMSNVDCTRLIYEIANDKLKLVCLSHISKNNNTEEFAYEFVTKYLNELNTENRVLPKIITASRIRETKIY